MNGMMKTMSAAYGGRSSISRQFDLEPAPGHEIDDARDDGLEMIP